MATLIFIFFVIGAVFSTPLHDQSDEQCGYQNCPKSEPGVLNVHIVAHTHDDVGWLKTVDQYYYGSRNNIQKAGVQYILDSVVKELWEDPKRKFIYVETAFFWKWWVRQSQSVQSQVRTLVAESRLQFVGGAWSMNDEAATHYQSTIDQFTWGLSKINDTFGPCALPRVGWQIDPFGHSREFASLLAAMGYDGLFLGRIDYQDKATRLQEKTMEMVWRGDDDIGKKSDIFAGILYNTYSPPPGFCFDVLCNDEPIIDDPSSPLNNVDEKVAAFISIARNMSLGYTTNNILVTMGEDFQYQDAAMWFTNLDKLIEYTNLKAAKDGLNIKLFYSTPNCYLKAVKDANPILPIKKDDFFPYASDAHSYWTGYYTSRPTTKYFERRGNYYLQMAKQLQVLAGLDKHNQLVVDNLKSAMGVMQHHDAITGTEKQHVTHDYERLLDRAIEDSLVVPRQAFHKMMTGDRTTPPIFTFERCRFNESSCHVSENANTFVVTLYNPVAWAYEEPVRVPVQEGHYEVYAPNGDKITSQLIVLSKEILQIPTRHSKATHELVFMAHFKPLMFKSFYIRKLSKTKRDVTFIQPKRTHELYENINDYWKDVKDKTYIDIKNIEDLEKDIDLKIPAEPVKLEDANVETIDLDILKDGDQVSNGIQDLDRIIKEARQKMVDAVRMREPANAYPNLSDEEMRMLSDEPMVVERFDDIVTKIGNIKLHFDKNSGAIKIVFFQGRYPIYTIFIDLFYYPACVGNNEIAANRSSGAYIFRPRVTKPIETTFRDHVKIRGDVVEEDRVTFIENAHFSIRYYLNGPSEIDWVIGPIDIEDNIGKEFIVKYMSDLADKGQFNTDSNGRQTLKRKLNERPQWNVTIAEPVGGNYYPVTNHISMEDNNRKITIVTDRSQGGSSFNEGEMELMLHRRLLHDDAFGVGEALNETANGIGLVVRGTHRIITYYGDPEEVKRNVIEMHLSPSVFVSDAGDMSLENWLKLKNCFTWLKEPLPKGLHLLTLEPWGDQLLLRLENYFSKSDNSTVEVDLSNILVNVNIKTVKEMMLSAYEDKTRKQWKWNTENDFSESFNKEYGSFDEVKKATVTAEGRRDGFKVKIAAKEIKTFIIDYDLV